MKEEDTLQQRLEKLGHTLLKEVEQWEQATRGSRHKAVERLSRKVERKLDRASDRQRRREARQERKRRQREEQRERERQQASLPGGLFFMLMALVCVGFAILRPELWWMVFVALGLGSAGARQLALASERRRLARGHQEEYPRYPELEEGEEEGTHEPETSAEPARARSAHEVDVLCDQLLADLAQSPEAVRGFLKEPEKTVESLRRTCRALDERRNQLFAETPPERLEALRAQRTELLRKHAAATDGQARLRLDEAVHSLGGQLSALERLRGHAERVDGEYTSLLVLLQELRTRVSLAKSAGSTTQLEGLRHSVQRLNTELDAITEALDTVPREGLPRIEELSGEDVGGPPGKNRQRT
jgi:hypothetical protein